MTPLETTVTAVAASGALVSGWMSVRHGIKLLNLRLGHPDAPQQTLKTFSYLGGMSALFGVAFIFTAAADLAAVAFGIVSVMCVGAGLTAYYAIRRRISEIKALKEESDRG